MRKNIGVEIGEAIMVREFPNVPNAEKIHVLPFEDSIEGLTGNITDTYLIPYFKDCYRPVAKGDNFIVHIGSKAVEYKIVDVAPSEYGIVIPETVLFDEGEAIKRPNEDQDLIAHEKTEAAPCIIY